jgi:CubicO group peptidase (beta-lactamase class C family)
VTRARHTIRWAGALLLAARVLADTAEPVTTPPQLNAIDEIVEQHLAAQPLPGVAVAITRGDAVVHLKGYGSARTGVPMSGRTQFFIASLSKSFTAVAILQLVESGRVGLDVPVRDYLPDFTIADAVAPAITVRHLLQQTSGLSDAGFPEGRLPDVTTIDDQVTSLRSARLVATPGAEFHYFNPNYAVLARIVEVVSAESFGDYLAAHVFHPLRMSRTLSVLTSTEGLRSAHDLAQGHLLLFGIPWPRQEMSGYLAGSGGVISTAEDMAHYLLMQTNGGRFGDHRLLSPQSVALMQTPRRDLGSPYGMGGFTVDDQPARLEHNGILSASSRHPLGLL